MNAQNQQYFDFTADAVGYFNEINIVTPDNGEPYIAIKASILEGRPKKDGKVAQQYIDMAIRGRQALEVINGLQAYWPRGYGSNSAKWMAGFRIGSLSAKTYFSKKSNSQVASLCGRLLAIKWLKINSQDVQIPDWKVDVNQAQQAPQTQQAPQMQPQMQQAPQMPLQAPQILQ